MTAVCTDNYGGGRLAAERLIAQGCNTIAYVGGRERTSTHLERRRGFLDALAEQDRPLAYEEGLSTGRKMALTLDSTRQARNGRKDSGQ